MYKYKELFIKKMNKQIQLNKLEQLLLNAIDIDNLPAIERYEAAIAQLKGRI